MIWPSDDYKVSISRDWRHQANSSEACRGITHQPGGGRVRKQQHKNRPNNNNNNKNNNNNNNIQSTHFDVPYINHQQMVHLFGRLDKFLLVGLISRPNRVLVTIQH